VPFGLNLASGVWTCREVVVFGSLLDGRNRAATPTVGRRSMSLLAGDIGSRLSDPPRTISISVFPAACQPIVGACIIASLPTTWSS
jgi:hypothetical protein